MASLLTVAIPVRDGARVLPRTLEAVRTQQLEPGTQLELIVCDSGSSDGSAGVARSYGAEVVQIEPGQFSHGGTRNLLMTHTAGDQVAFLSQDAVPADAHWLGRLASGFELADDVALVFGPYRARPDASLMVTRELASWFASLSPDRSPRIDRLAGAERMVAADGLLGPRGFFTDANGCVSRAAWQEVPFRDVPYAEDHVLAHDMLRAGFSKVFLPDAAVIHSHDYSPFDWLRRSFDEARAMQNVYGFAEQGEVLRALKNAWGAVHADVRFARQSRRGASLSLWARSASHHGLRALGTMFGTRADRLPAPVVERLSLERRR